MKENGNSHFRKFLRIFEFCAKIDNIWILLKENSYVCEDYFFFSQERQIVKFNIFISLLKIEIILFMLSLKASTQLRMEN